MLPTIDIFGLFELPLFGLMISIGVICFTLLSIHLFRKVGASEDKIDRLIITMAISGGMFAVSAGFFDALWHNIAEFKVTGVFEWEWWGITFSGGLLGGISTYFILYFFIMKYERHNVFFYFDIIVIGLAIAHGFGRIGCFCGGCCFGKVVEPHTFLSVYYPTDYGYQWVLPTQLYESAFLFLFAGGLFFIKKNRGAWYLIGYNLFRFFLEYLRGDDRGASPFGALSPSQFLSIIMFTTGILLLIFRKRLEKWLYTKNVIPPFPTELTKDPNKDSVALNVNNTEE